MAGVSLKIEAWAFRLDDGAVPASLHPADANHAAKITDPGRRLFYQRSRSLLRKVIGIRLGKSAEALAFEIAEGGKPAVAGCEFSLSHSGLWLVVAVSDAAVGVDIETQRHRGNGMALAKRFFSERDVRSLREVEEAQRDFAFLRQWVAKEAALKCEGVGLARHLHRAECEIDSSAILGVRWDERRFSIREFALPDGTPGAVAWHGDGKAQVAWRNAGEIAVS